MSAAKRWADAFREAWLAGDGEAAAALYAEDCVFRSHPFRDLEDARGYMRRVIPEAEAPEVWFGEPVEDGDTAAVEWWALLIEPDGTESTIAASTGCGSARTVSSSTPGTTGTRNRVTGRRPQSGGAD